MATILWDILYWIAIGLGCVAGVLAVIALVGCFLPRYHVAARVLKSKQPAEEVWKVISDYAATPTWHPEVKSVERVADDKGRDLWRETDKRGYPMLLETVEAVPPQRLVRALGDEDGPFSGTWQFDLAAQPMGCRLTLTERGQIPNPFFRFMFRLFMTPTFYLEMYLKALAAKLGDAPVLENPLGKP
jgi:uncharacterized protein YndB with AHSA1/START domain